MLFIFVQGLDKHGVGKWADISAEFLPKWDEQAIRIKATKLLGSQSLARYVGWKGDRSEPNPTATKIPGLIPLAKHLTDLHRHSCPAVVFPCGQLAWC